MTCLTKCKGPVARLVYLSSKPNSAPSQVLAFIKVDQLSIKLDGECHGNSLSNQGPATKNHPRRSLVRVLDGLNTQPCRKLTCLTKKKNKRREVKIPERTF